MDEEFTAWLETANLSERHKIAGSMRAKGATLREIGERLDVTAPRAGQICAKVERVFNGRHEAEAKRQRLDDLRKEAERKSQERLQNWRDLTADDLELGVRAANVLQNLWLDREPGSPLGRNAPGTLGEIADMTDAQLLRIPNCGWKTIRELREAQLKFAPESYQAATRKIDRDMKREAGLVLLEVWVPRDRVDDVREYVARMESQAQINVTLSRLLQAP
jgi:hypothetical protein